MVGGHVELVVLSVFQDKVFLLIFVAADMRGAGEPGHAMVDVHHVGSRDQVGKDNLRPVFGLAATGVTQLFCRAK